MLRISHRQVQAPAGLLDQASGPTVQGHRWHQRLTPEHPILSDVRWREVQARCQSEKGAQVGVSRKSCARPVQWGVPMGWVDYCSGLQHVVGHVHYQSGYVLHDAAAFVRRTRGRRDAHPGDRAAPVMGMAWYPHFLLLVKAWVKMV